MPIDNNIQRLRQAIENTMCRKNQTPKDFDILSETLAERMGEHVSTSTLKRIFGYVSCSTMPRRSTLDILSHFVGCKDWEEFCQQGENQAPTQGGDETPAETELTLPRAEMCIKSSSNREMRTYAWWITDV